ncbi:MAG: FAD-binding oxidoreductase, partial [Dehalococcoidia bacterium]
RFPDQVERTFRAGDELLKMCVEMGGAISGEHGIGFEKREQMNYVFTPQDLAAMAGVRAAFNPRDLFNPDKLLPAGSRCAELSDLQRAAVPAGAWI